jgi:hypothetical protein
LIVSQQGQSSHRPHRTYPQSPRGPQAPQALAGSTPASAPPRAASQHSKPDSPLAACLSRAARRRGGGCSSGQRLARPERAAVGCMCHQGHQS